MTRSKVELPPEALQEASVKKTLRHSHPSKGGRTIIQRIEIQMDKRRQAIEDYVAENGKTSSTPDFVTVQRSRAEGLAAALAIWRGSSVKEEFHRSDERMGLD